MLHKRARRVQFFFITVLRIHDIIDIQAHVMNALHSVARMSTPDLQS